MVKPVTLDPGPGTRSAKAAPTPALPSVESCVFLDVDGTLIDFAATPGEARVDSELCDLLCATMLKLGGAFGLVSGRPIIDLDRLFHSQIFPVAGMHGLERRDAQGVLHNSLASPDALATVRLKLQHLVAASRGLVLEDKHFALAVHFRSVPQSEQIVRILVADIVGSLGPEFELLEGDKVIEIKPSSHNKATAIEAFMREAPFLGRKPIFVGDDHTDRDGFAAVERHGGIAIAVGDRVEAHWRLPDPAAVRAWLASFVSADGDSA
jgi:trehalose 6-phosphate phosphatase